MVVLMAGVVEVLARLGLHACVAYIRKYAPDAALQDPTKVSRLILLILRIRFKLLFRRERRCTYRAADARRPSLWNSAASAANAVRPI